MLISGRSFSGNSAWTEAVLVEKRHQMQLSLPPSIQRQRFRFSDYTYLPFELFIALLTVLPVVVLMYFYPMLPERVPEYLNLQGEVVVWGRKSLASVFRLPLMAVDLQVLCLLMKYALWQGNIRESSGHGANRVIPSEESIRLQMSLWNWFRALIAFKLGASSLDPIFFGVERLRFLSTTVRAISWTAAVLGIAGTLFYGYRLVRVNRKLKKAGLVRSQSGCC
jgi:Protein of unknown function (DUF1648)